MMAKCVSWRMVNTMSYIIPFHRCIYLVYACTIIIVITTICIREILTVKYFEYV